MTDELSLFMKYAQAFEEAYARDDWGIVDSCFDENITWVVAGLPSHLHYQGQGRKKTSDALKLFVDGFDRRFDQRDAQITNGPVAIPSGVYFEFLVTYTREGLPPFELRGEEWDVFHDGKIAMHYELMHNGIEAAEYLAQHNALLVTKT